MPFNIRPSLFPPRQKIKTALSPCNVSSFNFPSASIRKEKNGRTASFLSLPSVFNHFYCFCQSRAREKLTELFLIMIFASFIFCVGFPHTLSGAAIFLSLFICIREPSVVTCSLVGRERTLGMRKLSLSPKKLPPFLPRSFCFILVKCSWLV